MKCLMKMTWMEAKLFFREPIGTFFTLGFPLMLLFIFGGIFGNQPSPYFNGYGSVDVSIPAYTAMIIATTGLTGLAITMSTYREAGVLRRLQTTPVHPLYVLFAQVIVQFVMTTLGMILLILAARLIYQMRFDGNLLSVLAGFTLSSFSFFAIGLVLAGLMPTARTAQIVSMALLYPMLFLCGAGYPLELLPESIHRINRFLPLTYVVKLLRGLWIGESWSQHVTEALVLAGILVVGVLVSAKVFRWE